MVEPKTQRLLCLSNGHGEDAIALRILRALQNRLPSIEISALPIVGEGHLYESHGIPIIGLTKAMPSGGFIYMDGRQFLRDMQGGLLQLTLSQLRAVRHWAQTGGCILAVGDIVPLLFGWISGASYAFVGTAKSEYYLRDEEGLLPRTSWFEQMESWSGSVYLPWERWLMQHPRCKAVFPRDALTTQVLRQWPIPAFDVGNPMMDDLTDDPDVGESNQWEWMKQFACQVERTILLLPGSRIPEAYENWELILQGVDSVLEQWGDRPLLFLAAIAPSLDKAQFISTLEQKGWQIKKSFESSDRILNSIFLTQRIQSLGLIWSGFNACIHLADGAIAMAGTATEQFVGLGKPAFIIPGRGPQFTPSFAEAQTRLLGPSVTLVKNPSQIGKHMNMLFSDEQKLQRIQLNGRRRMGSQGASDRIAQHLTQALL